MAKLTDEQIVNAKAWLHDIFVAGGIFQTPKRDIPIEDYANMYGTHRWNSRRRPEIIAQAKIICNALRVRPVDTKVFGEVDKALEYFSHQYFSSSIHSNTAHDVRKKPHVLAKYIAWLCQERGYYWNDSIASSYEKEIIMSSSTLGKALYDFKCFVSQKKTPKTKTQPTSSTSSTVGSTGGGQPQNPFKSRGALSNVAVDLIGQPNQKITLPSPIFCINGEDANGKVLEDTIYIRPVEADTKSQAKYMVGNTNKVLFGKAKGYGYCQVYFTSLQDATDFLAKIPVGNFKLAGGVTNIRVCQLKKSLSNGYFQIGTEYGPVYISASKLNEDLVEEITEDINNTTQDSLKKKQEDWERFEYNWNYRD